MTDKQVCPTCGSVISPNRLVGLCPACAWSESEEPEPHAWPAPAPAGLIPVPGHEILEEIARGGMGIVYRARQVDPPRAVALKMLLPHQIVVKDIAERFRLEARAMAGLDHPAILPVYHFGEHDGMPYFTMKLASGGTLSQRKGEFTGQWRRIAELIASLADAVHYAHERGVLHRDLKPGNVLFDETGRSYVSDFGLAKLLNADTELTRSADFLGTPHYVAPEVAAGSARAATTASDVYALGAILYELLAGRPPFEAESVPALLRRIVEEEPMPPLRVLAKSEIRRPKSEGGPQPEARMLPAARSERASDIRSPSSFGLRISDLEIICLKCLAKEPVRRYATAHDLAEDLHRWLTGHSITARPITGPERLWRWSRRNPALALVSLGACLAALALLFVLAASNLRVQRERNSVVREQVKTRQSLYAADIFLAQRALDAGNLGLARRTLEAHRPPEAPTPDANPATGTRADLRGFEWHYLWSRTQGEQQHTLTGHRDAVLSVAFSPDGRTLVTGSADHTVKRWDLASRMVLETFDTFTNNPGPITFLADGTTVAWAYARGVRWWRGAEHAEVTNGSIFSAVFSPVTNLYAFAKKPYADGSRPSLVKLADLATGRDIWAWGNAWGRPAFSHDGRFLAIPVGNRVSVRNIATGREEWRFSTTMVLGALVFSSDDKQLAGFTEEGRSAAAWEARSGRQIAQFDGHTGRILDAAFSPDGRTLATASADQSVRLWDAVTGQELRCLRGHLSEVMSVAFSPDGRLLASASRDQTVRLWSTALPPPSDDAALAFPPFALSRDGRTLAALGANLRTIRTNRTCVLWTVADGQPRASLPLKSFEPITFATDGNDLREIARSKPGGPLLFHVYDLIPSAMLPVVTAEDSAYAQRSTVLSPDGQILAVGDYEGRITLWDMTSGRKAGRWQTEAGWVDLMAFSADGQWLASFGQKIETTLWNVPTRQPRVRLAGLTSVVNDMSFSPDGQLLATAHQDNQVRLWQTDSGQVWAVLAGHQEAVQCVAFTPDGRTLASASVDGTIRFWHVAARREMAALDRAVDTVFLAFTSDGQTLISASKDGRLQFWRAPRPAPPSPSLPRP